MDEAAKRRRALKEMGGRVTTVAEFLGMSAAEEELMELELKLANKLKATRIESGLSQAALAKKLNTNQATIARMEACSKTSVEAYMRALRVLGQRTVLTFKRAS